jgi:two-component system sensor histidine kinase KdpD
MMSAMPRASTTTMSPLAALAVGSLGVLLIAVALLPFNDRLNEAAPALLLLIPVIATGALGGRLPAAAVALEATFAFSVGFLPPVGSPRVDVGHDAVALALFVVIAGAAGILIATVVEGQRAQVAADEARIEVLEQAEVQRSALLRSVSHDLRTPLATIRAVATDLHGEVPFDPADRQELLGLVIDEVERLDRIVANLLSLSRIEAGAFLPDREAVDIGELVDACTSRLRRVLEHVDLRTEVAPNLPLVHIDYSQFDQVLSNLLENAVRHSPEGGLVEVVVRSGSSLHLEVVDHGSGFAPEVRDRVFEPFATATGANSSGVGLTICRSIVEAHHGTISVSDTPGGGATLTVEVPSCA